MNNVYLIKTTINSLVITNNMQRYKNYDNRVLYIKKKALDVSDKTVFVANVVLYEGEKTRRQEDKKARRREDSLYIIIRENIKNEKQTKW